MRQTLLVLTLILGSPPLAQAATARFCLLTCGLLYLDDPTVRAELNLDEEQVGKLRAHRERWMERYGKSTLFDLIEHGQALCDVNNKELSALLDAGQRQRLRQLVLHDFRRRFGAFRTVRHPEVADALKLSPEQMARLEKGEATETVLTADQRQEWRELLGAPPRQPLRLTLPPPLVESWPRLASPARLEALGQPSVRRELKFDDKERADGEKLRVRWATDYQALRKHPPANQANLARILADRVDRDADALLSPEQRRRLGQILAQWGLPEPDLPLPARAFLSDSVSKELALTREQRHKLDNILASRDAALQKAAAGESVAGFVNAAAQADRRAADQLLGSLEADQRKRFQDKFGEPFGGRRLPVNPATLLPEGPAATAPPPFLFAVLRDVVKDPFVSELGLTAEQRSAIVALEGKASRLLSEALQITLSPREQLRKREEAFQTGKRGLEEVLKPEQLKRLREVLLQHLERPPLDRVEYLPRALAGWVYMSDELGLTPEQKDRLSDADDVREVLTDEQWRKWQGLRGKPAASLLAAQPAEPSFGLSARLRYVEEPAVRKELKLSTEQEGSLETCLAHWNEVVHRSGAWPPAERVQRLGAARVAARNDATALFTPAQMARLREVFRQQQFRESGPQGLLDDAELLAELKPSAEQLAGLNEFARQRTVIDTALYRRSVRGRDPEEMLTFWAPIRELEMDRLRQLLTEGQRKKLDELMGEPFDGPARCYSLEALRQASDELRLFPFVPPR